MTLTDHSQILGMYCKMDDSTGNLDMLLLQSIVR